MIYTPPCEELATLTFRVVEGTTTDATTGNVVPFYATVEAKAWVVRDSRRRDVQQLPGVDQATEFVVGTVRHDGDRFADFVRLQQNPSCDCVWEGRRGRFVNITIQRPKILMNMPNRFEAVFVAA